MYIVNPKLIRFFLIVNFFVFTINVNAQSDVFRALTMDKGLSNFVVTSLYKDSAGFMWIGTDISLDRFDGVNFKHFNFRNSEINKKRVKCITETTKGEVFVGNALGLWKLNFKTSELERFMPEIINCGISALKWNPKNKTLYIGSEKGLYIYHQKKTEFIAIDNDVLSGANNIAGIAVDDNQNLWLTTRKGLCFLNLYTRKSEIFQNNNIASELSFMARIVYVKGMLYIGTTKTGLLRFDVQKKIFYSYVDIGSDIITDLSTDGKDKLYVATDGNGAHFISISQNKIVKSYRYEPQSKSGIRSNSVYSLFVDQSGLVWVGFYQAGLDYSLSQKNYFKTYAFPPKFDSNGLPVRAFLINDKVKLIGTREGLYFIDESRSQVKVYTKKELRSNLILSLCFYKGEYYIGTYGGGISVLNPKNNQIRSLSNDFTLKKGHIFHIETGKDGNLWFATSGGVYKWIKETETILNYNSSNSQILNGNVYYLYFDSTSKGWIATENGLCVLDPATNSIKSNIFPEGFFNKEIIKVIYEDTNKRIYFCPDKGNVFVSDINMRQFSDFSLTSRFKDRVFLSILEDDNRNYWFGSDNGLISIREDEDEYYSFGFGEGIPDPVFSTGASYVDNDGVLWFGNAKGLLYSNKNLLKQVKHKNIPVTLTDFLVNGRVWDQERLLNIDQLNEIKLSYSENNLKIRFVSLQYSDPATVVYEYKLMGLEEEWQTLPKGQNEIDFTNLSSGNYTFIVRTEGNKLSERALSVHIQSFFSTTFWIILIAVGLIVYFFASHLFKIYKLLKQKINGLSALIQSSDSQLNKNDEKYKNSKISELECELLTKQLLEYLELNKPYTNPDLKIVDLAVALNCSSHTLSFVFNQYLTKNYYDFINEYRVKEFKRLVTEAESSRFTLSALAEQCGFSSRASFFRSFKKLTGITPNEFIRGLGKNLVEMDSED